MNRVEINFYGGETDKLSDSQLSEEVWSFFLFTVFDHNWNIEHEILLNWLIISRARFLY